MFLIVGLGNPGNRYRNTKHNLGYKVLESLAERYHREFKKDKDFHQIIEMAVGSQDVLLAKPTTYMNRSGLAVGAIVTKYDIELSHLLIVCDDFNLPLGKIRLRKRGSHGGHKGLASVIDTLGIQDFPRLRLGIGFDLESDATEFVLSPFHPSELSSVNQMIEKGVQIVTDFVLKGIEWTMNFYN